MKIIKVILIVLLALSMFFSVNSLTANKNKGSSNLKTNKETEKTEIKNTVVTSNNNNNKVEKTDLKKTEVKAKEETKSTLTTTTTKSASNEKTGNKREVVTADVVVPKNVRDPSDYTTFDKDVEAEQVPSGVVSKPVIDPATIKDNPPKPLSPLKVVPPPKMVDLVDLAPTKVYGLDAYGPPPKPKNIELLPVEYVKEISPVGKAALELSESGDLEYQKLLTAGFETPKTLSAVVSDAPTRVDRAATSDYMWTPMDPRNAKLWQNVEYHKYGNLLLDTHRYRTPAKFEKNQFGNIVVHAPSDSNLSITTPARNIISTQTGFLSVNESEQLVDEEDIEAFDSIKEDKPYVN